MSLDQSRGGAEFVSYCRNLMDSRGRIADAVLNASEDGRTPQRVVSLLRAAVGAGTTQDPAWAGRLTDYRIIASGFLESLRNLSIFDRLLDDNALRKVPLRTTVITITVGATAHEVAEGALTPVSSLQLAGPELELRKTVSIIAVSKELLHHGTPGGEALLASELRRAVSASTNASFLDDITTGAPTTVSSGATAANVAEDIEALLALVNPTATSNLYLVVDALTAGKLATKTTTTGALAYPGMTPKGGEIAGTPVLVADDTPADSSGSSMVMIDASRIAGGSDTITVDASEHATIQLNDAPVGTAAAVATSLWQSNLVAMKAMRFFGFEKLRDDAVAVVTGVNY